jgi:hypothetical protein
MLQLNIEKAVIRTLPFVTMCLPPFFAELLCLRLSL